MTKNKEIITPDFSIELTHSGIICGVDEAGRGPLAGPVIAAAAILDPSNIPSGLNDSKKLSKKKREQLFEEIISLAQIGVGEASTSDIDQHNILGATKIAMQRAVAALPQTVDVALIDGNQPPTMDCKVQAVIKGDSKSLSIAAASIIAKVTRDRIMEQLAEQYPAYGFEKHAGYGTKAHIEAIAAHGVCPVHRRSFAPVRNALNQQECAA